MDYLKSIAKLPRPTAEQRARFKKYLLNTPDWYKMLPLQQGGKLMIYLEPDLDREYPTKHPKLPYGNTAEGYEKAFGHLWFAFNIDGVWHQMFENKLVNGERKPVAMPELPEDLAAKCSTTLYPYCHDEFEEAFTLFEDDLEKIVEGHEHPQSAILTVWYDAYANKEIHWYERMTEAEITATLSTDTPPNVLESNSTGLPERVYQFFKLEEELRLLNEQLREAEAAKVDAVLDEVAKL